MHRGVIWVATTNNFKLKEYQKLLKNYEIKSISDLPKTYFETSEKGKTFAENALLKAKDLARLIGGQAIGDDSGIEVAALQNFPGVYSKRWAAPEEDWRKINSKLLNLVANSQDPTNRQATMVTAIAFYDSESGEEKVFEARVRGRLAHDLSPSSNKVFGYDPIFIAQGQDLPFSQLSLQEKNKISPRAGATKKLLAFLEGKNLK